MMKGQLTEVLRWHPDQAVSAKTSASNKQLLDKAIRQEVSFLERRGRRDFPPEA